MVRCAPPAPESAEHPPGPPTPMRAHWISSELSLAEVQKFLAAQGRAYLPLQPGDITPQLRREGKLADRGGDAQRQRRIGGEARRCFLIEDGVLLGEGVGLGNTGRQGVRGLKPGQVAPVPVPESSEEAGSGGTGE